MLRWSAIVLPVGAGGVVAVGRFACIEGCDALHGVDLTEWPGERFAMVGLSGAGKSTLGRLLAGIHGSRTGAPSPSAVRP